MQNIKTTIILAIAILILTIAPATTHSQTFFYLEDVIFSPDPLTSADEICVTVSGQKSTPCVYVTAFDLTENNGNLNLDMCFNDEICVQVLEPWDTTVCYGFLDPGVFELTLSGCFHSGIGNSYEAEVVEGDGSENPFASFTGGGGGCDEVEITFTNNSVNADTYFWEFGDGATSTEENPTYTFGPGLYCITLTASNSMSSAEPSTATICDIVEVLSTIAVDLGPDIAIPQNETITIDAIHNVPEATYQWSDGSTSASLNINGEDYAPGTYTFSVTVFSEYNCPGTDEIMVTITGTNAIENINVLANIYPNPAVSSVFVEVDEVEAYKVFDVNGKELQRNNSSNLLSNDFLSIDVSDFSSGLYFIEVKTSRGIEMGRFLVSRVE